VESAGTLVPFVLIVLAFYLLIIRPARKRASTATHLQDSLAVGQKIMTTSGMYAEIVAVEDVAVVLETSPGITGRWAKAAVARVLDETAGDGPDNDASTFSTDSDAADPDESGKRPE
jgi:preprotein translocase subunit YajC